jgi:uncharacterized protein DUF4239
MGATTEGLLIVGGGTLIAVAGVLMVRGRVELAALRANHDVAGYILAVVGTLYAVLLGLVVINVQNKYDQARAMAVQEANACSNLYQLTKGLPAANRSALRAVLADYVKQAIDEDWNAIARGLQKEGTNEEYRKLWQAVADLQPSPGREESIYAAMLTTMQQLSDARRFRKVTGRTGVSPVLWLILIAGEIVTVLFTYFFGVTSLRSHLAMVAFMAFFLSLNVFLIALYDDPYRADLEVKAAGFNFDPSIFRE